MVAGQTQDKPIIEPVDDVLVGLRLISGVHVHRQGVQLLQGRHAVDEQDDGTAALHRLHRPGEQVGGEGLEVLQRAHAVGFAEDLVGLVVVAVADVGRGDEQLERVVFVDIQVASFDFLLELLHFLLPVAGEAELLPVAPEDVGPRLDGLPWTACGGGGPPGRVKGLKN